MIKKGGRLREGYSPGLFVLPRESKLSGCLRDLELVKVAQRLGWKVLLDATGMSLGHEAIFKECKPDFVAISFFKVGFR